jgi:hypothetical protein
MSSVVSGRPTPDVFVPLLRQYAPFLFVFMSLVALASVLGCEPDDANGPAADVAVEDLDSVAATDTPAALDLEVPPKDTAPDLPPPDPCMSLPFEDIVPVDLYGPDTQIHGAAAFDGAGIWVTYIRGDVDGGSGFDVFATRIGCDGAVLVEPFLVNEAVSFNETDPAVAVSGDTVMFAWQSESGQAPTNLSVWYRSYDVDGTPRMDQEAVLDFDLANFNVEPNAWMPALSAVPEGFALAVAAAPEGYNVFQTWLQLLSLEGLPTIEGLHVSPDPDHSQVWPVLGLDGDETLVIAWEQQHIEDPAAIEFVEFTTSGEFLGPWSPAEVGTFPSFAARSMPGPRWVAFGYAPGTESQVALYDTASPDAGNELHLIDNEGALDHSPVVVAGPEGQALAWYRNLGGLKNDLLVRPFSDHTGVPVWQGEPIVVNPVPAAPYAAALVALPGGFFAVWSDGDNPAYRVKSRFVRTPEARR